MNKPKDYVSPIPIAPGETIKEFLNELEMSQKEFAARLGVSEKHVSQIINGSAEITRTMAEKLESVLGISAIFWLNLENNYQEALKKVNPLNVTQEEEQIARSIPYSELANQKYVSPTKKIKEKIVNLRRFFAVSNLKNIPNINVAYRKANIANESIYALLAWVRIAEINSQKIETKKFNKTKLIKSIPQIRELTIMKDSNFYKELVDLLSSCGIALVVAEHIKGTGVNGVTFLNSKKNKLIIQLSVRGKFADKFWFTLFHELAHIINDETGEFAYIDCDDLEEINADKIARDLLIPPEQYEEFVQRDSFRYSDIQEFAKFIDIHPCIVIGRLKYDRYLAYNKYVDKIPKFQIIS